jgi:hypothetical protein
MERKDDAGDATYSRPPNKQDLISICRALQETGARYVLVGGLAMGFHGRNRMTHDIDLLVDPSPENMKKIKEALMILPDKAITEIEPGDLEKYVVVRIADEVVIDLMGGIGEISVDNAGTEVFTVDDVNIMVADIKTVIETKRGLRPHDKMDLLFLQEKQQTDVGKGV